MEKLTLYIFSYDNGDCVESDCFVERLELSYEQREELARRHIENEYEYDRENFTITEIYAIPESFINEIIESRK